MSACGEMTRAESRSPKGKGTLPEAFVDYWRFQASAFKDLANPYRALLFRLTLWEKDPKSKMLAIPGYDEPPKRRASTGVPAGWSYATLTALAPSERGIVYTGWRPVNTPPDDDQTVIIHTPDCDEPVTTGFKDGSVWRDSHGEAVKVTHWRPLPPPPAAKS